MDYEVVYTKDAMRDLDRLEPELARRILKKVSFYAKQSEPLVHAKQLKGFELPTYRFRVGDYRVVFRTDPKTDRLVIVVVIKIRHRKEVYRSE